MRECGVEDRVINGMTQTEYPEKILKIYPRVLMELERDRGNPTLETLEKMPDHSALRSVLW